jgi:hypothetical protein
MTEYDDIKVNDVVRWKIPWFREVVGVVGEVYSMNILIPTAKKERAKHFFDIDDINDGANRNFVSVKDDPLIPSPPMRPPKRDILRPFPTGLLPLLPVSATPGDMKCVAPWIEFNLKYCIQYR